MCIELRRFLFAHPCRISFDKFPLVVRAIKSYRTKIVAVVFHLLTLFSFVCLCVGAWCFVLLQQLALFRIVQQYSIVLNMYMYDSIKPTSEKGKMINQMMDA